MTPSLDPAQSGKRSGLEIAFLQAHSHSHFLDKPVDEAILRNLYEHVRWAPTSMNCQPMRIKFFVSEERRAALAECVYAGNRAKVMSAPVCAVLGMDLNFPATLPRLFAHKTDAEAYYAGKPDLVAATALRNSSLQAGFFMIAARLSGLDCGPMSGFDAVKVDALCWTGTAIRTNMLCNLGYGDPGKLHSRNPRHAFEEVCHVE